MYRLYPRLIQELTLEFARNLSQEDANDILEDIDKEMNSDRKLAGSLMDELLARLEKNNRELLRELRLAKNRGCPRLAHDALKQWHERDAAMRRVIQQLAS